MNRWDRRESIFHDDADRQRFIETFGAGKGSGRTIDSFHRSPPRFRQNVTLLTDPIDNCFAIHRLLTVVSRRNRRAILTFPTSPLRRRPKSASSQSIFASSSAMIRRAFSSADWPISLP